MLVAVQRRAITPRDGARSMTEFRINVIPSHGCHRVPRTAAGWMVLEQEVGMEQWIVAVSIVGLESDLRIIARLGIAVALGGVLGWERERENRPAGLRTHMIVALGAALFTVVPLEVSGPDVELVHIVKGLAAGVGFLGAGTILKRNDTDAGVKGLTTAANIWVTAAIGFAVGCRLILTAAAATGLAFAVLAIVGRLEVKPAEHAESASR